VHHPSQEGQSTSTPHARASLPFGACKISTIFNFNLKQEAIKNAV